MKKQTKRGGKRAGAGRKPSGRKPYVVRLSPHVVEAIDAEADRREVSRSEEIESRLVDSLG